MHYFTVPTLIFLFLYLHCKKYRTRPTSKWEASLHEGLKNQLQFKMGNSSLQKLDIKELNCFLESNLFYQCRVNCYQTHACSLFLAFTMPLATSVTVHVIAQTRRMSNRAELRDLRSESIHFKNKYKYVILNLTLMPQIKEAFVASQLIYKIYITISIRVLFWCHIYSHNIF